jgi:exosortase/archaeosortase family protein
MLSRHFFTYLASFLTIFCVLYYGTIAFIGIVSPGGFYWSFGHQFLDFVAALRHVLLKSASVVLTITGHEIFMKDAFTIKVVNGLGVHVGYDCIGYGVIYFWVAFILANQASMKKKLKWLTAGVLIIFSVNIIRIALMVVAVNNHWQPLFGFDNHTWFNIAAYTVIFTMIYLFDKSNKAAATMT